MRLEKWIKLPMSIVSEKYFKNGLETTLHYCENNYYFKNGSGMHFNDDDIIDVILDADNNIIVYIK